MAKYTIISGGKAKWKLSNKETKQMVLKSMPGTAILNPYHYFDAYFKFGILGEDHFTYREEFYITTTGIILRNKSKGEIASAVLIDGLSEIFRFLKLICFQYDLSDDFVMRDDVDSLKPKFEPNLFASSDTFFEIQENMRIRKDILANSASWSDLKKADHLIKLKSRTPTSDEILMDAFIAMRHHDYRKSILYSCIACESLITAVIDETIEDLRRKQKLKFTQRKNKEGIVKDPVFDLLNRNAKFLNKIHAVSLYVLDRSLLNENEDLYRKMAILYSTRNKIAHSGDAPLKPQEFLGMDQAGAAAAFDYALLFFNWLGFQKGKSLESFNFGFAHPNDIK